MILGLLGLSIAAAQVLQDPAPPAHPADSALFWVSARTGNDATGDGSEDAPYRSLTQALRQAAASHRTEVILQVDLGRYDAEHGEVFPLHLPTLFELRGLTARNTILDGGGAPAIFLVDSEVRRVFCDGLTLQNAAVGLGVEKEDSEAQSVILNNVLWQECKIGLDLQMSATAVPFGTLAAVRNSRIRNCEYGIRVRGEGRIELVLQDTLLQENEVGLFLDGNTESRQGVRHAVNLKRCQFLDNNKAGVLREGENGLNQERPYSLDRCVFQGSEYGVYFAQPSGDSPVQVRDCQFLNNDRIGLGLVGMEGNAKLQSEIQGCDFRWNGVGLHLTNLQVRFQVHRNRVVDNLGNGIFCSSYPLSPSEAEFSQNLIAHNGACGFLGLSDGKNLKVVLRNNSVIANAQSGIERRNKHSGVSQFQVEACVLYGNTVNLRRIEPEEVSGCMLDRDWNEENDNMVGKIEFFDPLVRDYRLTNPFLAAQKGATEVVLRP